MPPPSPGWRTRSTRARLRAPCPGPERALPSAPVFAGEPIYNSLPGVPALQLPLSPNLNPGLPPFPFPASGAAQPSAPGVCRRAADRAGRRARLLRARSRPPATSTGRAGHSAPRRQAFGATPAGGGALRAGRHPERSRSRVAAVVARRRHVACAALRARARRDRRRLARRRSGIGVRRPHRGLLAIRPRRCPASGRDTVRVPGVRPRPDGAALPARDDARRAGTRRLRRARVRPARHPARLPHPRPERQRPPARVARQRRDDAEAAVP